MLPIDCLFSPDSPHPLDGQVFDAIGAGDIPHLEALFSAGARANAIDPVQGQTALSAAVAQDCQSAGLALTRCLLERGADINGTGLRGETALMAAAGLGSLALVTLLLEQGACVTARSDDGDTALSLAAGATQWVAISENKAEQTTAAASHKTSLHLLPQRELTAVQGIKRRIDGTVEQLRPIAEAQAIAVVERLLAAGAQLNPPNCITTPLMEASRYGQLKLMSLLLQRGADPSFAARDEQTALGIAKLYNQTRAMVLLEAYSLKDLLKNDSTRSQSVSAEPEPYALQACG